MTKKRNKILSITIANPGISRYFKANAVIRKKLENFSIQRLKTIVPKIQIS